LPYFTGISTYNDPQGRFKFRYPSDWVEDELDESLDGVNFRPMPDDLETYFAVAISKLDVSVEAADLPELRRGFDDGLTSLTALSVDAAKDDTYGNIVKFERKFTFDAASVMRKRWTWGLYADVWQIIAIFQGSTVAEYDYWLPMGNYCFNTFELPEYLWFATDPDMRPPRARG
jgi:hypothetical protein